MFDPNTLEQGSEAGKKKFQENVQHYFDWCLEQYQKGRKLSAFKFAKASENTEKSDEDFEKMAYNKALKKFLAEARASQEVSNAALRKVIAADQKAQGG